MIISYPIPIALFPPNNGFPRIKSGESLSQSISHSGWCPQGDTVYTDNTKSRGGRRYFLYLSCIKKLSAISTAESILFE